MDFTVKPELFPDFRSFPLFSVLDAESLGRLTASSFVQQFPSEVVLQQQDTIPDFLYALLVGSVEVTAHHRDALDTVEVLGPGSVFTLAAVVRREPALSMARTTSRSRIIMIPASLISDLIDGHHAFARSVIDQLASSTRALVRKLHNQKMRTSTERLANWIVDRQRETGTLEFDIPYQKRVLASLLGMTPENLSRTFAGLEAHGVRISGRSIQVHNPEALTALAAPTALIDGRG